MSPTTPKRKQGWGRGEGGKKGREGPIKLAGFGFRGAWAELRVRAPVTSSLGAMNAIDEPGKVGPAGRGPPRRLLTISGAKPAGLLDTCQSD